MSLNQAPLGRKTAYLSQYQRELLFPIARKDNRAKIGIQSDLPFKGIDIWNAYELSWLNSKGKPVVAVAEFIFPCDSPFLIEAKSLKLYLNSFNNTRFASAAEVSAIIQADLSEYAGATIKVAIVLVDPLTQYTTRSFTGFCLDHLDVTCDTYQINLDFLQIENTTEIITETVFSDLLKSNCLITGQPDWGSIQIEYTGPKINHEGLLKYIISYRDHHEFGEQCVERIFMDIQQRCSPQKLSIYARYTRRGGKDINPYRSTEHHTPANFRLCRQ